MNCSKQLGPFVDINNELISSNDIPFSFEELLQNVLDEIANKLRK